MKPVLTGDNGDQAANISNILACEDHPGPFTAGPPEPLGLIPRWPWWGCIYVRSVPLSSADVLGSRPRKGGRVTPVGSWLIAKRTLIVLNHTRVLRAIFAALSIGIPRPRRGPKATRGLSDAAKTRRRRNWDAAAGSCLGQDL